MKTFKTSLTFATLICALSANAANDSRDFLSAAKGASWGSKSGQETNLSNKSKEVSPPVSTQAASKACTREDQNSIPYKFFSEVILGGKALSIRHQPNNGTLSLSGGAMISNCNDMIKYNFVKPSSDTPYAFQVEIKKPAGNCEKDEEGKILNCTYKVTLAEGGLASGEEVEKKFSPDFDGYLQCLKESGVFKEGQIQEDKIAFSDFNFKGSGAYETNELMFMSHGPEADHQGGGLYSNNERPGLGCYYYEQISSEGSVLYSQAEIERNRKKALFNKICRSGDYKLIDSHLPDFTQFKSMHTILKQIRNQLLEDEAKNLHGLLQRESYAKLDAEKFGQVSKDFYNNVIVPKREEIQRLVNQMNSSGDKKGIIQARIDQATKELVKYTKAPYLNDSDRKNMKSFAKKSPLDKESWRDAVVYNFAGSNTAYHYSRFASDSQLEELSPAEANDYITADIADERDSVEKLGTLALDPQRSFAQDAQKEIRYLQESAQYNQQAVAKLIQEEVQHAMQVCPSTNYTQMNVRMCQEGAQQEILRLQQILAQSDQRINTGIQRYTQESTYWSQIEAQRNAAYNITPQNQNANNNGSRDQQNNPYTFSFTPRDRGTVNNSNMTMEQRQMQLMQQQQMNINGNGRTPSNFNNNQYMNMNSQNQQTMPAGMNYYMNNQTSSTGPYQFRY